MVQMPGAVSQPVTTASHPHAGTAGGQGTSPAVAGQLSQHSHYQLGLLLDHPQTFQFSLLQAEDSLEDNISLDNNVHDFCFNLCYDSVQANKMRGYLISSSEKASRASQTTVRAQKAMLRIS